MSSKINILINGKKQEVLKDYLFSVFPKNDDTVLILNGFQTSDNVLLKENDEIFLIEKGVLPPKEILEKMISARHTPKIFDTLKNSKVAIAGLGGLGSNIAVNLARIGVGNLLLVDFDIVEPSNLNRQSYYIKHLGMFKTDALKQQLQEINPFINITTKNIKINEENCIDVFSGFDIICEAIDKPDTKANFVNSILLNLPNTKIVAGSGMAGYGSSNDIKTERKMKNLYVCGDFVTTADFGIGLMSPRVQICAGHQANMVLRLLLGIEFV